MTNVVFLLGALCLLAIASANPDSFGNWTMYEKRRMKRNPDSFGNWTMYEKRRSKRAVFPCTRTIDGSYATNAYFFTGTSEGMIVYDPRTAGTGHGSACKVTITGVPDILVSRVA